MYTYSKENDYSKNEEIHNADEIYEEIKINVTETEPTFLPNPIYNDPRIETSLNANISTVKAVLLEITSYNLKQKKYFNDPSKPFESEIQLSNEHISTIDAIIQQAGEKMKAQIVEKSLCSEKIQEYFEVNKMIKHYYESKRGKHLSNWEFNEYKMLMYDLFCFIFFLNKSYTVLELDEQIVTEPDYKYLNRLLKLLPSNIAKQPNPGTVLSDPRDKVSKKIEIDLKKLDNFIITDSKIDLKKNSFNSNNKKSAKTF